ncbi:hypothetical protein Tco_0625106 [Tanacetum coccineum]|uniref:Uncharacterized protein n=1 Tax=Tanacetum coccineum TaxID=301880 RepID=A0ABQ4WFV2_9ASTR
MGGNSLVLTFGMGIGVEKPGGSVISLSFVMPKKCENRMRRGLTQIPVNVGASHDLRGDSRNCFRRRPPAKGVGLHMADSHTGNHREDDFMPLETIRRFSSIIWEKISFKLEGEASEQETKAEIRFDKGTITLKSGKNKINFFKIPESPRRVEEETENDIDLVAPTNTISRLILEWEERIKLHQEKEMEFDQWRSKVFNDGRLHS